MELSFPSILKQPFDFSFAFDQALKQIVATIPGRPPAESAPEVVSNSPESALVMMRLILATDVLLRICR